MEYLFNRNLLTLLADSDSGSGQIVIAAVLGAVFGGLPSALGAIALYMKNRREISAANRRDAIAEWERIVADLRRELAEQDARHTREITEQDTRHTREITELRTMITALETSEHLAVVKSLQLEADLRIAQSEIGRIKDHEPKPVGRIEP